jgi:hypothetical protein
MQIAKNRATAFSICNEVCMSRTSFPRNRSTWSLPLGLLALFLTSGCGGPRTAQVSGTITYNGKPLPRGTIGFTLIADDKRGDSSPILEGKYVIHRAPVGMVKVTITGGSAGNESMGPPPSVRTKAKTSGVMKLGDGVTKGEPLDPNRPREKAYRVPSKYATPASSDLAYDVRNGSQTRDFDLPP